MYYIYYIFDTVQHDINLHSALTTKERKRQKVHQRGNRKVSILFNGRGIQNAIVRHIKRFRHIDA